MTDDTTAPDAEPATEPDAAAALSQDDVAAINLISALLAEKGLTLFDVLSNAIFQFYGHDFRKANVTKSDE